MTRQRAKDTTAKGEAREPLRGHAAWKAEKERIAERNQAAYARGRQERTARDAAARADRQAAEKRERASLPSQPPARRAAATP
jgi:hypothetical protein